MSKLSATIKDGTGRVKRLFAAEGADAHLAFFRSSMKDALGRDPSADEEKYFLDGHDVIAGGLTWRLSK